MFPYILQYSLQDIQHLSFVNKRTKYIISKNMSVKKHTYIIKNNFDPSTLNTNLSNVFRKPRSRIYYTQ